VARNRSDTRNRSGTRHENRMRPTLAGRQPAWAVSRFGSFQSGRTKWHV
jgi:hypothetical protein